MRLILKICFIIVTACILSCSRKSNDSIITLAEEVLDTYPDSALNLLSKIDETNLSEFQKAQVTLNTVIAKNKMDLDISGDTAIFNAVREIEKQGTDLQKAKILLYAGRVLYERHDYENALSYVLDAKNYSSKIEDNNLKGLIIADLGRLNYQESHYEIAISHYKQAFSYFCKTNSYNNQIISLQMIGNCFLLSDYAGKKDSSFYYYDEAIKISEQFAEKCALGSLLSNLGVFYIYFGEYQKSFQMLEKALLNAESKSDSLLIFLNLADAYFSVNYLDSASYYINKTIFFLTMSLYN